MKTVEIYSDGACRGNPGMGGWGALLSFNGQEKRILGYEAETTNNRMELMASIEALKTLNQPCHVILWTDSQYVKKGMTEWLAGWKAKNWRTASNQAVKNQDLWQQLDLQAQRHQIEWRWVKGHAGNYGNEIADQLANQAIDQAQKAN
ncbi:ribonuclease HI [Agitococcus lubricus]|uniref:Ribonuclease H n=1 Tax=Agitococcus lubricus TaxID=1077255 RepID=A0A2T5J1R5_9GAMM|nr:ribonuclease HI [Agitococcus lubricus]